MNIQKLIIRTIVTWAIAASFTGCTIYRAGDVADFQGKVWRGNIVRQFTNKSDKEPSDKIFVEKFHYNYERDKNLRMVGIHLLDGRWWAQRTILMSGVALPDNIEFADVKRNTIVDIMLQRGDDIDYDKSKFSRIIRIICHAEDSECRNREWNRGNGTLHTVIDPTPAPDDLFGNTYNRRITPEERTKYQ